MGVGGRRRGDGVASVWVEGASEGRSVGGVPGLCAGATPGLLLLVVLLPLLLLPLQQYFCFGRFCCCCSLVVVVTTVAVMAGGGAALVSYLCA